MKRLLSLALLFLSVSILAESPRRYIVEYTPGIRPSTIGERRFRVRREFSRVLHGAAIELAEGQSIEEIAKLPYVARVTPDGIVSAYEGGARGPLPAARVAARGAGAGSGEGIVVAVIDTGVDAHHPALAGKVVGGYDFVNDDDDPMDDHRHGTHVAGIIAASSSTMNGVAPGVSLLAYKVLDATGHGEISAIVAGIDRAVADGADVINLSLGKGGYPDDPMARAVDAATAAGVVVVVAAGNGEDFHRIGSPGVAASAITVGATQDAATLAGFSSGGPANRSGAIKPEIVAPGVAILSTVLNGQFAHESGTSMAAPYVAGLAALLRAQHPDWTPARVKAALVNTALPIARAEVMAQGAGRVDRERAFASDVVIAPVQINFGLDATLDRTWSSTRTIAVRNESNAPRTIRLVNQSTTTIHITPSEITLAPNETRDVQVSIDVDHQILGRPKTGSLSFGGWVVLEWDGGDARVPWAFVRAARAVVTYPGKRPLVGWSTAGRYGSFAEEHSGVEALLEPGVYDMIAMAEREGDVRLFAYEEQTIGGDLMYALTPNDAPHAVTLDGVDARGLPLESPAVRARFVLPGASIVLPPFGRTLHASTFSPKYAVFAIESSFDGTTMHIVQHPLLRGIDADVTLRNQPADFEEKDVKLRFADARPRNITLMPRDWPRRIDDFGPVPQTFTTTTTDSTWTLRLRMTREPDGDHVGGLQINASTGDAFATELITPTIRRDDDGFFALWGFTRTAAADTTLDFGDGPIHVLADVASTDGALGGRYDVRGEGTELFRKAQTSYRVFDANDDAEVARGSVEFQTLFAQLPRPGRYRAELLTGASKMTMLFTTGATLPTLTSLTVDSEALTFSTTANPSVFFRRRGASTWVQLSPVAMGEGVFRVDLDDVVRVSRDVELLIEMESDGNWSSWVTPVLIPAGKRRAARW